MWKYWQSIGSITDLGVAGSGDGNLDGLVQVQFARAAVIVQPIRDIGMLLDFAQSKSTADGVNRAGGNEESIAGLHLDPIEQLLDLAA